jgi:hypothetical protein
MNLPKLTRLSRSRSRKASIAPVVASFVAAWRGDFAAPRLHRSDAFFLPELARYRAPNSGWLAHADT